MKNLLNTGKRKVALLAIVTVVFVGLSSLKSSSIYKEWVAPASASNLKNPVKSTEESIKEGKKLYKSMCSACHGVKGKGDGLAAASLNPKPANFWLEKIQKQTDGAIYWKLTEGRSPMAGYKESLTDTQRWQLVNFIRTFKK